MGNEGTRRPYDDVWCPHMRLGVSKLTGQGVEMLPSPALNAVLTYAGAGDTNPALHLTARCQGPACPHWRRPLIGNGRGRCALSRPGAPRDAALVALAAAAFAAMAWLSHGGM